MPRPPTTGGRLSSLVGVPVELARVALVAVLLALFLRTFLTQAIRIPSSSMEPTLAVGDHILVNRFVYGPSLFAWERSRLPLRPVRTGDVVAFRSPRHRSLDFVKRCVATGGQQVQIVGKQLRVDGQPVDEQLYARFEDPRTYPDSPFLDPVFRRRDHLPPSRVPANHCFVLGDHRDLSDDSRYWGPIDNRSLRGRLVAVYWPADSFSQAGPRWVR